MKYIISLSNIFRGYAPVAVAGVITFILMSSCFTGVESTKRIELSKRDKVQIALTEEDTFLNVVKGYPHTQWSEGKSFYATDNRTAYIFESDYLTADTDRLSIGGKVLQYRGIEYRVSPNGDKLIIVKFSDKDNLYRYNSGKAIGDTIYSTDIPMMVDLDLVDKVKEKLVGRCLWTRSSIWYDINGEMVDGKKFVPVTIKNVEVGDKVFPIRLIIADENGDQYSMLMNLDDAGVESRSFATLFYLQDPRKLYSHIEPEVWELIQEGKLRVGMTKEECRLSIGAPKEVNKGHNYSSMLELWQYTDGVYLQFQDGLLVNFRR